MIINFQKTRARVVLLVLLMLHLHSCCGVRMISYEAETRRVGIGSRKMLVAVNRGKLKGVVVEPQKAVVNGLRKRPPTSSNPRHNR
ncbi:hypothetical protein AAHA92_24057 [Salvia divinorum]|uniref:Uncharacterized protein n=1 Tax=Salvia divinorum TaxID=28513 RepID=A0ABD1G647_SALDI